MWDSFNSTMAPGALDPLTKELVFLAVGATNGCAYCTAAHGTVAKTQGMSSEMLEELMAVVSLANEANRLAAIYRIPVDDRYEALGAVRRQNVAVFFASAIVCISQPTGTLLCIATP